MEQAITAAIRQGAPMFNAGQPDKCRQLYMDTALQLVGSNRANEAEAQLLRKAIEQAAAAGSVDGAWVMRRAFDAILDGSVAAAAPPTLPPGAEDYMVLDFERGLPPAPRWSAMDDVVMGGISSSGISYDAAERAAVFSGEVSTGNGGGFASVRSQPWGGFTALSAARGVRLLVKGDGRQYKLNAKGDDAYDGVMYQHDFSTNAGGAWQTVDLPFAAFKPNFRGRLVTGRPPLCGDQVRQVGIMVSKFSDTGGLTSGFRPGRFRLAVKWIKGLV